MDEYRKKGYCVGVMVIFEVEVDEFYFFGKILEEVVRNFFKVFREFDK